MQNKTLLMVYILIISSFFVINSGCNNAGKSNSAFGTFTLPSVAPATPPPPPPPPPPVLPGTSTGVLDDDTNFYVGIDTANEMIGHVHAATGFKTACGISKDSTANEDVDCIFEIPEGDLYAKDLFLRVNVPKGGMCRYVTGIPFWFYNFETGTAPSKIEVAVTNSINASGDVTSSNYSCIFDGVAAATCNSNPEVTATLQPFSQSFACVYDYTATGGPNCCLGSKKVITTTTNNGVAGAPVTVTSTWGGNANDCIGGPGKKDWTVFDSKGFPVDIIIYSENGYKDKLKQTAPINFPAPLAFKTASIAVANFYGQAASHDHTGFVDTVTTSTAPYFMDPIDDRDGTAMKKAQETWELQCLDAAFEIKHRIRVKIREWDAYPDYLAFISSEGAIVQPDRGSATEPAANCTSIPFAGYSCNDSHDMDDFLKLNLINDGLLLTPFYNTSDVTKRKNYFPAIKGYFK